MSDNNKEYIEQKRDRVIATLLSFKDDRCDSYLPESVSRELRILILDQVNSFTNFVFDLMDDDVSVNSLFLDRLEMIMDKYYESD